MAEMQTLARQIHPSGDLRRVWELMKDETPPWEGVMPMAQRYVDLEAAWLHGAGSHIITLPSYLDYAVGTTTPMGRRGLSFGGSQQGPTIAGRQSGYYVITPLEDRLTGEERGTRLKGYNPYQVLVTRSSSRTRGSSTSGRPAAMNPVDRTPRRGRQGEGVAALTLPNRGSLAQVVTFVNGCSIDGLCGVSSSPPLSVTTMSSSSRTPNSPRM
jgi:hypothetical protein